MIEHLKLLKDRDKQEKQLKQWCAEKDPKKREEIMKQAKKAAAKRAKKAAEAAAAGGGLGNPGDPPLPSIAHMQNPETVGRQGTTPDTVNPADFKGFDLDIYAPEPRGDADPEIVVDDSGE